MELLSVAVRPELPRMTGATWRKSPKLIKSLPPNGRLFPMTSCNSWSVHSRTAFLAIGSSS
jgi:hypothetical protein